MSLYEVLKASKTNRFPDYWTLLWARKLSASMIKTLTGTLPLTFTSTSWKLAGWTIYGNDSIGKNIFSTATFTDYNRNNVVMTADKNAGIISIYSTDTPAATSLVTVYFVPAVTGNYLMSGVPTSAYGGLQIYCWDSGANARAKAWDKTTASETNDNSHSSVELYLESGKTYSLNFRVLASYGKHEDPVIVSPMVRLDGTSSGFEPYTVGVGKRTKNLFQITENGGTVSGITYTTDIDAGTATFSGTCTSSTYSIYPIGYITFPEDTYVYLSGGADGGSNTTWYLYAYDMTAGARPKKWNGTSASESVYDSQTSQEVLCPAGHRIRLAVLVRANVTVDNIVFKPMLRAADTDAEFIPFGYEIPLAVTCDRNLFNIYGNMAHSGGVHTIDFNVETSSITGEMPANSFYQLGIQNAIVKGDETFVISFDKITAGTAELQIVKGEGSGAEILETFDISEIKSYRVVFECEESFGNVYPRLVATEAATQTFEHLMIKKASDKGGFVPYGAKYEYNVPIDAPLTEGQSVSDTQTIEVFEGENTIDTTLYNKPTIEIKYK